MKRGVISVAFASLFAFSAGAAQAFELKSPDLAAQKPIAEKFVYNSFGCKGENVSPALEWTDPPAGAKSFAVLVHDPDAPTGGAGFWHWLLVDIPASTRSLPEGAGSADGKKLPAGARQLETDFGEPGYGGPCPPPGHGVHHYNFTVYALPVEKLDLPANARTALIGFSINKAALAKATLTATYGR
ncbi:YbhB/YbcL family Raf kinase inhibitor-like protein [Methylocystis heyeri]|uniref:YbhB/YbcL family Raf kinase inhibitor-like protein n=1 Tax=Methylocystis heyeri TaxID=391905 RepID=A0A6B8KE55_9HYPH|nr:YbhB/YbcL family Raf kinase inhibitor-like protein [Methylocystis heyeri]QGM45979.1 YbhB/YbcL family Raf kinase inhibitor-like protein [Methylocystis heyeri]